MTKKTYFKAIVPIVFLLTGCNTVRSAEDADTQQNIIQVETMKGPVDVSESPERVVVFDMGMLDTIDDLGLGDKVVGAPKSHVPAYLSEYNDEEIANTGTIKEPDFEAIYELEPDIIFISGRQEAAYDQLSEIAPTVYLSLDYRNYWNSFEEQSMVIGSIFAEEEAVTQRLKDLDKSIKGLNEKVSFSGLSTLTVLLNEGNLSAYGSSSRFGVINDVFGFESTDPNIQVSNHGQAVSYEYIVQQNPDILFVVDRTTVVSGDSSNNNLSNSPLIKETAAYQNDSIVYLDAEVWYLSGGGFQSMDLMIEEINQALTK